MTYKSEKDIISALGYLKEQDSKLALLIDSFDQPKLSRNNNYFQYLVRSIIFQQLNGTAAQRIYERFVAIFKTSDFPKPEDILKVRMDRLRKAGLSERKASYVKGIAQSFIENHIRPQKISKMSDDEIRELLIQIKGIGNWTVDIFLMFCLNRTDILPVGDYGIKQGFMKMYRLKEMPDDNFMYKKAKRWQPHRTLASRYLWLVADNGMPHKKK